jgi:hypothetical protein
MKQGVWEKHLRPALSTAGRLGRAWIYGVPRPSAQFAKLSRIAKDPANWPEYAYWKWSVIDIIGREEYEKAKTGLDPLTFAQEYDAERVALGGRAYYQYGDEHEAFPPEYDKTRPLILCFDFNNAPGVCIVLQELPTPDAIRAKHPEYDEFCTCIVGEVHIPRHSNSELVAKQVVHDWGKHQGKVCLYGDYSGGNHTTQAVFGSDWEIITNVLRQKFSGRVNLDVVPNPPVRRRVISVNTRLKSTDGKIHLRINAKKAPRTAEDLANTMTLEGTAWELDKDTDKERTHHTDAFGYYIAHKWPAKQDGVEDLEI